MIIFWSYICVGVLCSFFIVKFLKRVSKNGHLVDESPSEAKRAEQDAEEMLFMLQNNLAQRAFFIVLCALLWLPGLFIVYFGKDEE